MRLRQLIFDLQDFLDYWGDKEVVFIDSKTDTEFTNKDCNLPDIRTPVGGNPEITDTLFIILRPVED